MKSTVIGLAALLLAAPAFARNPNRAPLCSFGDAIAKLARVRRTVSKSASHVS